jgi:UDP-3-O-[3-hydroxymyristoyl] glucosamine N-acyltransferase
VIIGADGFRFSPDEKNTLKKVPQVGKVIIEDDVEVGANTTIDRATFDATIIRKGVKLDNLIMIGHNVEVGAGTVIAGQSGIAGSSKVGRNCMFGGQVGLIDHIEVADGVKVAAQSGLTKDIKVSGEVIQGSPAFDFGYYQKCYLLFKKLPEMRKEINQLERDVDDLKTKM